MDHLEPPSEEIWSQRRNWFESQLGEHEDRAAYLVSEQACALMAEVQSCYCAGAWVAVIVLAYTVLDAQLLETEVSGFKGNSKELLECLGYGEEYQQLRLRRNRLIHFRPDESAITVDQQYGTRPELEDEAKKAVRLMLAAFFSNPSV
jgi:hypothetical protein